MSRLKREDAHQPLKSEGSTNPNEKDRTGRYAIFKRASKLTSVSHQWLLQDSTKSLSRELS
ncbi:uncharacterized protein RAG0_02675 [Rhynchosporium agropyri]|uniref:Uncharacterized protein n=1 Tax=Rhynchosporium agropyri TaxID=914238 RepID=A0A1E1K2I7_9HELO|nr:uncharacterized protein RAG0_02675 [Rhynchosporium agropyri]